ncbi:MAG: LCP family protein [Oscillospiraceae bacterium]|jgi:LCP family protein required for cell wall assembly|nr:LCP family protein [Oscillospiraceae bacterium]
MPEDFKKADALEGEYVPKHKKRKYEEEPLAFSNIIEFSGIEDEAEPEVHKSTNASKPKQQSGSSAAPKVSTASAPKSGAKPVQSKSSAAAKPAGAKPAAAQGGKKAPAAKHPVIDLSKPSSVPSKAKGFSESKPSASAKSGGVKPANNSKSASNKQNDPAKAVPASKGVKVPPSTDKQAPSKKRRKNKLFKAIAALVCVLLVGYSILTGIIYSMLGEVKYTKIDTGWQDSVGKNAPDWAPVKSSKVRNILIMGIDTDGEKGSRSDTMMIVTIDRVSHKIRLTSLLRDLYVSVPGHGETRLNHAYAYGAERLLMQTVESNFRIKIDEFVSVDFNSFSKIITTIGGVTIKLTAAEAKYLNKYSPGEVPLVEGAQRLTGEQALEYSRIRQLDSDFKRTGRQRTMLEALMDECRRMPPDKLLKLVGEIAPNLKTNIRRMNLTLLVEEGLLCFKNPMDELALPLDNSYASKTISGMAVLVPDMQKNCEELHKFIFGKVPG